MVRRLSDLYNQLQDDSVDMEEEFADYRKLVKSGKKGDIFNLVSVVITIRHVLKRFQYAKRMFRLFRAIMKFCSANRLFTYKDLVFIEHRYLSLNLL